MLFYSTNGISPKVKFSEALLTGQAPDRGLYMPESVPALTLKEIARFSSMEYHEIACELIGRFTGNDLPAEVLAALSRDAYNFDIPLEHVCDRQYVMRLDQGPTASFKDFAARMMARLMNYYLQKEDRNLLILTATSGDTGSAVAHAFFGLDRIRVLVLFPENEVTDRQRKQMTTLGRNINILSLNGKFDDCQALVKQAFADPDLNHLKLSSANSINIGRLIPQMVYYYYAYSRLAQRGEKIIFSVPSGNFGDMMGGVLAMNMGLPVERFIISVNENDEFPRYLETGIYSKIEPSKNCISSAMNVGHPSNLARLMEMYGGKMDEKGEIHRQANMKLMNQDLWSATVNDERTRTTIKKAWENYRLLLEPHGAAGWAGLEEYLSLQKEDSRNKLCVAIETAHPAKFPAEISRLLGFDPELPPSLQGIENKAEQYEHIPTSYNEFKNYLQTNY